MNANETVRRIQNTLERFGVKTQPCALDPKDLLLNGSPHLFWGLIHEEDGLFDLNLVVQDQGEVFGNLLLELVSILHEAGLEFETCTFRGEQFLRCSSQTHPHWAVVLQERDGRCRTPAHRLHCHLRSVTSNKTVDKEAA